MGTVGGYDLPYFSKDKILTKSHFTKQYNNDHELAQYLPDQVSPSTITREFLLALLYNIEMEKYLLLYNAYKEKKKQSNTTGGKIYKIVVGNEYIGQLRNYTSTTK